MVKRRSFIAGLVLALSCAVTCLFAAPPHAFNRHHVPPGWAVCNKCNGAGCVVRNWLGITKRCEKCNGLGIRRIVRNMPIPPPLVQRHPTHHNHHKHNVKAPRRTGTLRQAPKKSPKFSAPNKGGKGPARPNPGKGRR